MPITSQRSISCKAFTLVELLVVMAIISILVTLTVIGFGTFRGLATRSKCSSNLRQLSAAVTLYTSDNNGLFPSYVKSAKDGTRTWFFGYESSRPGTAEGKRNLDITTGPLYPYIQAVGKIEVCPGFNYEAAIWKAKFKGASYGYGYNWLLGGKSSGLSYNIAQLSSASKVLLFGDCGQINTFQKPASPSKPMIEEFYYIDEKETTVHFRHNGKANILFVDGHVEVFTPYKGTADKRIKGEIVGRITKKGSMEYLQ